MQNPSQNAVKLLEKAVSESKRHSTVRLPLDFARDSKNKTPSPPLHTILARRGEVRLKVFLTTLMRATRAPHETEYTLLKMAQTLDYGSGDAGRRRVRKAIQGLEERNLVQRIDHEGKPSGVQILYPDGSGKKDWNDRDLRRYIGIPIDLWKHGWFHSLSGSAIGLIIILLELRRPDHKEVWVDGIRKREYGFSDDFWTKATKELQEAKLLSVKQDIKTFHGESRKRNLYTLHLDRLKTHYPSGESIKVSPKGRG